MLVPLAAIPIKCFCCHVLRIANQASEAGVTGGVKLELFGQHIKVPHLAVGSRRLPKPVSHQPRVHGSRVLLLQVPEHKNPAFLLWRALHISK